MQESTKFRLLVVGVSWPPETFLAGLIKGLTDAGVEVTVSCTKMQPKSRVANPKLRWLRVPTWQGSVVLRLIRLASMAVRAIFRGPSDIAIFASHIRKGSNLAERLRTWNRLLQFAGRRWDVIYFAWNSAAIDYIPLFDLGCPVVVSCRGSQIHVAPHNPERLELRQGLRATFERATLVHCVSEATMHEAQSFRLDSAKSQVIRPSVDTQFFFPLERDGTNGELFRLMTTGRLIFQKGLGYALHAVRLLLDEGISLRFDIVGDGPERQYVTYTIYDLGLERVVHLHGRLPLGGVQSLLRRADAFLLASVSEGISNAVIEAMACGLPVVTTNCGGMREAVQDCVEGFVVPVRDPIAISDALRKLAVDPELRLRMGRAARERVLREFSLDQQVGRWLTLYAKVVNNSVRLR